MLLSFTPEVLEKVGGFKVLPARWGYTHVNWTRRIVRAELAPFTADICESNRYVRINRFGEVSSIGDQEKERCSQENVRSANDFSQIYCALEE